MLCSSDHFFFLKSQEAGGITVSWSDSRSPHSSKLQWKSRRRFLSSVRWLIPLHRRVPGSIPALFQHALVSSRGALWVFWNFQAAGLRIDFSSRRLASLTMFFVSKVIKAYLMLLLYHELPWSTSEPLQRLSTTRTGRCCSWVSLSPKCAHLSLGHFACQDFKDQVSDTSNVTNWHAENFNHPAFKTSLEYPSCFELYGEKKCISYMQTDLQIAES